jgi:hypothetical protein
MRAGYITAAVGQFEMAQRRCRSSAGGRARALTRLGEFSTMVEMTSPPSQRPEPDEEAEDALEPQDEEDYEPSEPRSDSVDRSAFERILPELIRRGLEVGRVPLERVSESIFPKDIASHLVSQLGDIRSGVVKAVAQEVGRFLREADIAAEVRKVLTGLDIEASVKLRFNAREGGAIKPEVEFDLGAPADERKPGERRKR